MLARISTLGAIVLGKSIVAHPDVQSLAPITTLGSSTNARSGDSLSRIDAGKTVDREPLFPGARRFSLKIRRPI